jgi:hypothetical protein
LCSATAWRREFELNHGIHVHRQLIAKHELAVDDLHARTERRAARGVADREEQLAAGLEDVLERIARLAGGGRSRRGSSSSRWPPCRHESKIAMVTP